MNILTTPSGYSLFTDICVESDFITSDHLPLCFTISVDNLYMPISSSANNIPCDALSLRYNWYGTSDLYIFNYYSCTRDELSRIKLPLEVMLCEDVLCNKHRRDIYVFYSVIIYMVVLNNVYLYLNYTMITLLQVGMTMLAIITIYLALILNGGWLITDHVMGQFIMH